MCDSERTLTIPNSHYNLFGGERLSEAFVDEHFGVARSSISLQEVSTHVPADLEHPSHIDWDDSKTQRTWICRCLDMIEHKHLFSVKIFLSVGL